MKQQTLTTLTHESISNKVLITMARLAFDLKFKDTQFLPPVFIPKYNYWLIEVENSSSNVTINQKFDVDCVLDVVRVKTHNQRYIQQIIDGIIK